MGERGRESDAERDGVSKNGRARGADTEREGVEREKEREHKGGEFKLSAMLWDRLIC